MRQDIRPCALGEVICMTGRVGDVETAVGDRADGTAGSLTIEYAGLGTFKQPRPDYATCGPRREGAHPTSGFSRRPLISCLDGQERDPAALSERAPFTSSRRPSLARAIIVPNSQRWQDLPISRTAARTSQFALLRLSDPGDGGRRETAGTQVDEILRDELPLPRIPTAQSSAEPAARMMLPVMLWPVFP
jgi:hypothetical protein